MKIILSSKPINKSRVEILIRIYFEWNASE